MATRKFAHAQQGGDQGRFAAGAIAVMAEYRSADRAAEKPMK
jgi:hypothetical protein